MRDHPRRTHAGSTLRRPDWGELKAQMAHPTETGQVLAYRFIPRVLPSCHPPNPRCMPAISTQSQIPIPTSLGAVSTNPCFRYRLRPGGSASRLTYAPGGASRFIRLISAVMTKSPRPLRWCAGSTAMSMTWKYQPPSLCSTQRPQQRSAHIHSLVSDLCR